ncbi:hypothetical protein V1264_002152 [Littorina saxatilis]|uniref:Uncharacterized protein n=1 Tax=Littorina saxatilis TaxID=31220 RepID=A0AAN9GRT2_9CAEN
MSYSGPVQYLVTGKAGSLPDRTSTQRHCSQYGHVDHVKETDEGLLVTINNTPFRTVWSLLSRHITALHDTHHEVNGHRVAFHLLYPDVYGCDVTVTRHRVSVTVGHEVICRITQDETYKLFSQALLNGQVTIGQANVSFLPNQIEVQSLNSLDELPFPSWEWELCVLQQITAFLKPFKDLLPQTIKHTSYRERCIHQECRKETSQSKDLDINDGEAIAVFKFTHGGKLQVAASEDTLKQLRQSYPTIDISCDTGMKALTLRGPARAVYQAREDMCSLVKN